MATKLESSVIPIWESFEQFAFDEDDDVIAAKNTGKGGTLVKEVMVLRTGQWDHPKYGKLIITPESLEEIVQNFHANVRGVDLSLDAAHKNQEESYGWFKGLRRKGNALLAKIEFTDLGKDAIARKRFRYISAELAPKWTDDETGHSYRNVLLGAGLTNRPYIRKMVSLDEDHKFSEVVCLSENLTDGQRGCMLIPVAQQKRKGPYKFSREDEEMPEFDNLTDEELDALADEEDDDQDDLADEVSDEDLTDEDIDDARDEVGSLLEIADELSDDDVEAIIGSLTKQEQAALEEYLDEIEQVALSEGGSYDDEDGEGMEFSEDDDDMTASLGEIQVQTLLNVKSQLDAIALNCEDDLAQALSEASAGIEEVLSGAEITALLSESNDPAIVMLAEQFLQQKAAQNEQAMALHEESVDELVSVLLHDPETNEAVISPQQAEITRDILLSAPAMVREMFCAFLENAAPIMTFDERGTSYADPDDLPVEHPDSTAKQIVALAERLENRGYAPQEALRRARIKLMGN